MSYAQYLATNELFWAAVTGALAGAAVAQLTWRFSRRRLPRHLRARRAAIGILLLALASASAAAGLILPPELAIASLPAIAIAGASLVLVGLALRFPRAVGVTALLLVGAAAVFLATSISGWTPIRSQTVLAELAIVSMTPDALTVEIGSVAGGDGTQRVVRQAGGELLVRVEELSVSPYLFVLGARRFTRYAGLESGDDEPATVLLPRSLYEREESEARAPNVNVLQRYQVVVTPQPGSVALVRIR